MNSHQANNSDQPIPNWHRKYINESLYGVYFGIVSSLACHPCDRFRTLMQANTRLNTTSVVLSIYQNNGIKGFYRGIVPNMTKASIKQTYRWPLQSTLPTFYANIFGEGTKEILTGLTIGTGESIIITTLEFFKTRLMLSKNKNLTFSQLVNMRPTKINSTDKIDIRDLLKSINPVFWRQIISWCTYLWTNSKLTNIAYELSGTRELSPSHLLITSLLTGAANTLTTMPMDAVKTRAQKPIPEKLSNSIFSTFKKINEIYSKEGLKALYAGSKWRIFEYMIHASIYTKFKESQQNNVNHESNKRNRI